MYVPSISDADRRLSTRASFANGEHGFSRAMYFRSAKNAESDPMFDLNICVIRVSQFKVRCSTLDATYDGRGCSIFSVSRTISGPNKISIAAGTSCSHARFKMFLHALCASDGFSFHRKSRSTRRNTSGRNG